MLISAELPRDLRSPGRSHELREIPEVYGRSMIGWETLPERLLRDDRDLTLPDVLRIQHMLGQKPHEAGAAQPPDDRRRARGSTRGRRRPAARHRRWPGSDGVRADDSERLAEWLDAEYEPYGAHSHYGLIAGENSFQQVADGIRSFLDSNRL